MESGAEKTNEDEEDGSECDVIAHGNVRSDHYPISAANNVLLSCSSIAVGVVASAVIIHTRTMDL